MASIDYPVEHLVIVDNSGTQSWTPPRVELARHQWVIQVPKGLGLAGAWNLIIKSTPYTDAGDTPYWLLVNDDAWFQPGALELIHTHVDRSALNFPEIHPRWSGIAIGDGVVERVGLYSEDLYPIYFDDNDYERRIRAAGIPVRDIPGKINHENSSTLKSGFEVPNHRSFKANSQRFAHKLATNDYSEGHWSLRIRRENRWD